MKINIMTKITASFVLVVVVFGAATIYVSHRSTEREKNNTVKLYEERGLAIAKALDSSIVADQGLTLIAQGMIDKAQANGIGITEFSVLAQAPEGQSPTGYWTIASNNQASIHSAGDAAQLDVIKSNAYSVHFSEQNGARIIDVTYPLHNVAGKPIALAVLRMDMSAVDKLAVSSSTYLVTIIMIVVASAVAILISYTITRPLRKLTAVTDQLAAGNINVTMPEIRSRDEIYDLNESLKGVLAAVQFLTDEVESTQRKAGAA